VTRAEWRIRLLRLGTLRRTESLMGAEAAALLAFALSIDDFVITNFNAGATVTFPLFIWGAARVAIPPQINVIAAGIFLVTVVAMLITVWQQRRAEIAAAVRPDEAAA
jgi:spermidine/putrescine transport system permease protein